MNAKILTRFTGTLLLIESVAFAVCFFVSLAYGDSDMSAFAVSFIISVTLGWLLRRYGDKTKVALTRHDSFVIVGKYVCGNFAIYSERNVAHFHRCVL